MQTFLPYEDFRCSAQTLDRSRLGKQRVEAFQIFNCLTVLENRWVNHPATRMWRGYEAYLACYYNCMLEEWSNRGYQNVKLQKIDISGMKISRPFWLGNEKFHSAHRAALLWKNPIHYGQFNWMETPRYDYWWPV